MKTTTHISLTDKVSFTLYNSGRINRFLSSLLNDVRNLSFIYLIILIMLTTLPWGIILFIPGNFHLWLALLFFIYNTILLMGPFILMQHNVAHKMLFKRKYNFLNKIIPWVLGPFFGLTPETYKAHHIGMHHPENNLPHDLSTTMMSQRDSFLDFTKYFIRFIFLGIPNLSIYLKYKKRKKLFRGLIMGETVYFMSIILLFFINWKAATTVFLIPLLFTRFMMMAGNWAQHAFIDKESPGNCYRNSITCINSGYNKRCWNDGYHIGHHIYPWLHWTEMPGEFLENIENYKKEDAIVFRKLDYFMIWFLLMTKNYNTLSNYYVELNVDSPRSKEEVINLLKERTKKI